MVKLPMQQNKGFTLIEMLVSISLFAVVITMGVGTLLVIIDANGRAQSMQLIMTNFSFALDSMTREIRTGTNWYCGTYSGTGNLSTAPEKDPSPLPDRVEDCSGSSANYISISESGESLTGSVTGSRITYWYDATANGPDRGAIKRCIGNSCGGASWVPLTGEEIDVDEMVLEVHNTARLRESTVKNGASNVQESQPILTLYIKGKAGFELGDTGTQVKEFELQTSITQRTLDL